MKQFSPFVIFCFLILNMILFILYFGVTNNSYVNNKINYYLFENNISNDKTINIALKDKEKLESKFNYKSIFEFLKESYSIFKPCPLIPPNLIGKLDIKQDNIPLENIEKELEYLKIKSGGEQKPIKCRARYKVAIIVPYRKRETNLKIFLRHMHPFLSRQLIEYGIYIVEPLQNLTFNRGLLMNIGFIESLKITNDKWDCFMFHDVDLIPEDDRNIYSCPETPRHMSSAVSKFKYKLPYNTIFGGVSSLTKKQMKKVNGYSNLYFGWGGEDDDFRLRITKNGYSISRYPLDIGRYLMINHKRDQTENPKRFQLLKTSIDRMAKEGLNSIDYKVTKIEKSNLFTRFYVLYDEKYLSNKLN